jgi:hypothetical protein
MKPTMENDPDLKQQQRIIGHHPHTSTGMPPHGTIRKAKPWMMKMVHNPKKKD